MEDLGRLYNDINIETKYINQRQIQKLMDSAKYLVKNTEANVEQWNKITETLWRHLETGLPKMDLHLLCATCFFNTITLTNRQIFYQKKVKEIIEKELSMRVQGIKEGLNTSQLVSLIYGMFQSSFLINKDTENYLISELIQLSFIVSIPMAYEYSQYTYIVFKIIYSFKKLIKTEYYEAVYNKESQIVLLNLVNHNWENPITGVRDLNRGIFQTLLTVFDDAMLQSTIAEINLFYWNKAKYLMLTAVIAKSTKNISTLLEENNWLEGLTTNLHKPGLISAVSDMYFAVLEKLHSSDKWCDIFLHHIVKILSGTSSRAIEYVNNYWILTTFKKFPMLLDTILSELETCDDTEQKLYSILYLVKQGYKLAVSSQIWEENLDNEDVLKCGIQHYNTPIRMLAFDIVCSSQIKIPSNVKYVLILEYLKRNINSDSTVLRISMLKTFHYFMGQLHHSFKNMKDHQNDKIDHMVDFCKDVQELIINSLNCNGNYQRNITSIKLANTLIGCLHEIPTKKRPFRDMTHKSLTLLDFLRNRNCWMLYKESVVMKLITLLKDPSDDIRENVTNLLLSNYQTELKKPKSENEYFSTIENEALKCIRSKFFYDVICGQTMFHLIVNLLSKEKRHDGIFISVKDIFHYGYSELLTEHKLKRDIIKTIEEGKQLHSFISILKVVFEAYKTSFEKLEISNEIINNLLAVLKDTANQFSWEQSHSTISDFSKMSDMVEHMIEKSGHKSSDEKDETKISGLHQMVLNCLWLNVKASCELASLLVYYNTRDIEKCSTCLMIITNVLETSRHKGAIEAAGVALGRAIQYLTNLPEDSEASNLPQTLLKSKLCMLISEASKMASITRRGAGLSIMVHRIVSSDMRKGKPLFHYFMKTLLHTCKETADIPNTENAREIENEMDLPKAILIHFLTKIVTDSSLASDMMFYSAELAELAFGNLKSPHWQIRNAALQLYGALIQKLIGQKKDCGTDDETVATVGCDELRTHSPKLWEHIREQLKNKNYCNKIEAHANLIPILNMLANTAKRYNFSSDLNEQKTSDEELLESLIGILDSPIHTVRRLTAKCIFNIFPFEWIYNCFMKMNLNSENLLHGALLLIKLCYEEYYYHDELKYLEGRLRNLLESEKHSYWTREVFESTCPSKITTLELEKRFYEAENSFNVIGISVWLKTSVKNCIQDSCWENIPKHLSILLAHNEYESYCEFLFDKLKFDTHIPNEVLVEIADILLGFQYKFKSCLTWKMLYQISLKVNLANVDVKLISQQLETGNITYNLRYIIPFAARVFSSTIVEEWQQEALQNIIFKLSDYENADFDMRYISALANNEMANNFDKLSVAAKALSIKTAVLLLQDEDEDVRNASVTFYKNIKDLAVAVHPNICLIKILDRQFLEQIFCESQIIQDLCQDILDFVSNNQHSVDEDNPFANDSKNIYIEVNVLKCLLENLKI